MAFYTVKQFVHLGRFPHVAVVVYMEIIKFVCKIKNTCKKICLLFCSINNYSLLPSFFAALSPDNRFFCRVIFLSLYSIVFIVINMAVWFEFTILFINIKQNFYTVTAAFVLYRISVKREGLLFRCSTARMSFQINTE